MKPQLLCLLSLLIIPALATSAPVSNPVPGGIALIPISDNYLKDSATFKGKKLALIHQDNADYLLVGLSLNTKAGKHTLKIKTQNSG